MVNLSTREMVKESYDTSNTYGDSDTPRKTNTSTCSEWMPGISTPHCSSTSIRISCPCFVDRS